MTQFTPSTTQTNTTALETEGQAVAEAPKEASALYSAGMGEEKLSTDRIWTLINTAKRLINDIQTITCNRENEIKKNKELFEAVHGELSGLVHALNGTIVIISD